MAWVAVNRYDDEYIFEAMPKRFYCVWAPTYCEYENRVYDYVELPKGSIKKLIGRELSWNDEPVELKEDYRIKPEPKYRPFKDAEECWQEMQNHQPFGWLKDKNDGHLTLITVVDNEDMMALNGRVGWDFLGMMNNYVFADGTPFGVKIEKEE